MIPTISNDLLSQALSRLDISPSTSNDLLSQVLHSIDKFDKENFYMAQQVSQETGESIAKCFEDPDELRVLREIRAGLIMDRHLTEGIPNISVPPEKLLEQYSPASDSLIPTITQLKEWLEEIESKREQEQMTAQASSPQQQQNQEIERKLALQNQGIRGRVGTWDVLTMRANQHETTTPPITEKTWGGIPTPEQFEIMKEHPGKYAVFIENKLVDWFETRDEALQTYEEMVPQHRPRVSMFRARSRVAKL